MTNFKYLKTFRVYYETLSLLESFQIKEYHIKNCLERGGIKKSTQNKNAFLQDYVI